MGHFERFVSRRYLFAREKKWLVSAITFISMAGVMVGVAALIVVLGVIEGIDRDIFAKIVEIYPHLKITESDTGVVTEPEALLKIVREREEVELAEPIISKQVLFTWTGDPDAPKAPGQLIGVESLGEGSLYDIPLSDTGGSIRLQPGQLLLGYPLAWELGLAGRLQSPEEVQATTGILARTPTGFYPRTRNLDYIGTFTTGVFEFDSLTGFISNETARAVFGREAGVDYVHVKMKNPFTVRDFKKSLAAQLGADYAITTWEEENGEFFQALKLEKLGLSVVLLLVVIVASFNIVGTLILMVMEKTREIGILKAFGCSDGAIRRTFLNSGLMIGLFGTGAGVVLGLIGCYLVANYISLGGGPATIYSFNRLPVDVRPWTVTAIAACALLISLTAAIFPAVQAARLDPIEALRHD